jgi:hypothetical protein
MPVANDSRGALAHFEFGKFLNFQARRIFQIFKVTEDRGGHAHRHTNQLIIASHGELRVEVFSGEGWNSYILDDPSVVLFTPKLTFLKLCDFSSSAVCTVLSDTEYRAVDSIRNLEDFVKEFGR